MGSRRLGRREPTSKHDRPSSIALTVAWFSLLAIPIAVPLAISVFPVPGGALTYSPFLVPKLFTLAALVALGLVAWAYAVLAEGHPVRPIHLGWPAWVFLGLLALTTLFALHPLTAIFGDHEALLGLSPVLMVAGACLLAYQLASDAHRQRVLARSIVWGGTIVAVVAFLQFVGLDLVSFSTNTVDWIAAGSTTIGNRDIAATFLVIPFVLALALALSQPNALLRYTDAACVGLIALGLLGTMSRGAWVAATLGAAVLAVAAHRSAVRVPRWITWSSVAAAMLLATVIGLRSAEFLQRFEDLASGFVHFGSGRLVGWAEAFAVIARHPLLGVGLDSYRLGWYPVRSVADLRLAGIDSADFDPHNVVLLLAADLGIPGALLVLAAPVVALARGASDAFRLQGDTDALAYAGWWTAVVASTVALLLAPVTLVTLVPLAMSVVIVASRQPGAPAPASGTRSRALVSAAAATAVLLAALASAHLASDYQLRFTLDGDSAAVAQRASALAPWSYRARHELAVARVVAALVAFKNGDAAATALAQAADSETIALVAFDPHEYESHYLRTQFLAREAAYTGSPALERTVQAADAGLAVEPVSTALRTEKAWALGRLGKWQQAADALQGYWDLDPQYTKAPTQYAETLVHLRRPRQALAVLDAMSASTLDAQAASDVAAIRAEATTASATQ